MRKSITVLLILVFLDSLLLVPSYRTHASSAGSSAGDANPVTQMWKFTTDGSVYTSPIVTGGYVYAMSSFITHSSSGVYCINASTGAQIWNYSIDTYVYTPLIVANGYVYTISSSQGVFSVFNASTGDEIWNTTYLVGWAVFAGGSLYVGALGIYKLDANTGKKIWSCPTEGPVGYPIVTDDYVFASGSISEDSSSHGIVYCLDASTGVKQWEYTIPEQHAGSLVVSGGHLFMNSYDVNINGGIATFAGNVYCLDANTGTKKWNYPIGSYRVGPSTFTPIAAGDLVYVGSDDNVYALDASSGIKIWNYTTEGTVGSPLFCDPYLYVGVNAQAESERASVYSLNADSGAIIWNCTLDGSLSSPLVEADDQIYVGSAGPQFFASSIYHDVYALDAITGEKIWNYTIEGNVGHLTIVDYTVYVGTTFASRRSATYEGNGAVYALKPITSSPLPSTLVVIVVVVVVVILLVVVTGLRIYFKKRKHQAESH
jgi:outer membrane protein assembly factor BamB